MNIESYRKIVYEYFNGKTAPIVLIIIGILTSAFVIGVPVLIVGLIWYVADRNVGSCKTEEIVDNVVQEQMKIINKRAYEKLNVDEEQTDIIDPICLYGPVISEEKLITKSNALFSLIFLIFAFANFIISLFVALFNRLTKNQDITKKSKLGSDGKWRYSYVQFTIFLFDRNQLYIYFANVDITSGIVYEEGTYEYYYNDIVCVSTNQIKSKQYLPKKLLKKSYMYIINECLKIYTGGCNYTASISTDLDHSVIDKQFLAMKSLIRDKKLIKSTI